MGSFDRFQREEAILLSEKQDLIQRIQEWEEVVAAIQNGKHPYNNLTEDLTQKLGKFGVGMLQHLQGALTQMETREHDPQ